MLSSEQIRNAAEYLIACRKERRNAEMPQNYCPASRAEGYLIQARLEALSAKPVCGWKIAATSVAGQEHIGVDGPLAGRIFVEMLLQADEPVSLEHNRMRKLELEFAFRMGRDLPPRQTPYERDEVLAAVDSLHLSLEIPDARYATPDVMGAPLLIADNACADRFIFGPPSDLDWRARDLAGQAVRAVVNEREEIHGRGSNVLGCPTQALTWLANELSRNAVTLRAGQIVSTGTCLPPVDIKPGDRVLADFGPYGALSVSFV